MGGQQHLHVRVQQNRQTQKLAVRAVRLGRANDKGLYFFPSNFILLSEWGDGTVGPLMALEIFCNAILCSSDYLETFIQSLQYQ